MKNEVIFPVLSKDKQYLFSTLILFIIIMVLYYVQDTIGYETVSLILLLIIFLLPILNFERGPIIVAAIIGALAWDYYFIPPHFTMHIGKAEDIMMLVMFFVVAVTSGILTAKLKGQKDIMIDKERRMNALYNLLKDLSMGKNLMDISNIIVQHIENVFGFKSAIFLPTSEKTLNRMPYSGSSYATDEMDWLAAQESFRIKEETGKTTQILPNCEAIYFPLSVYSVIGVKIDDDMKARSKDMEFLKGFLRETISFIEKFQDYSIPKA